MIHPYNAGFFTGLRPLPDLTVAEWANENRILTTRSSAEAGKYSTDRTPYAKQIMEVMSPKAKNLLGEPATEVVFVKGSQLGGSETLINCVGYYIDLCPCPILYMLSTVDLAKFTSTDRIDSLIEETPSIRKKIGKKRTHNAENSILKKGFTGGSLRFIGANSPVGMRSAAVRVLILDEVSSYPHTTEDGDPVELANKRADTFGDSKKILAVSTPTIEGKCKISRMFEKSDQRFFYVPCPHCQQFQVLEFDNLKWKKGNYRDVYYECKHCQGKIINELHKNEMLKNGKWIAKYPDRSVIGFHLSSMYSPVGWKKWSQIAKEYDESRGDPSLEQIFDNNNRGIPYRLKGESVNYDYLYNHRRGNYNRGIIPRGGLILTCGIDIQGDRAEAEVVAWGRNKQSFSVDYKVFFGDIGRGQIQNELAEFFDQDFVMEDTGETRKIQMICIDSSFNTSNVYNFTRKFSPTKVVAIKGKDELLSIHSIPKNIDYTHKGKTIKNSVRFMLVGVSILKQELYGFLKNDRNEDGSYPYGYCHFPSDYPQEYFQMLTAEEYICTINEKKQTKFEWVKIRERNEALDCRNYARAAASLLGYDRLKDVDFDALEEQYGFYDPELEKNIQAQEEAKRKVTEQDDYWKNRDNNSDYWKNR